MKPTLFTHLYHWDDSLEKGLATHSIGESINNLLPGEFYGQRAIF